VSLESLLGHPLTSIFVGFVLTGVVGTLVTNHFADRRQHEARAIERREVRRKAIVEVSRLFSERLERAEAVSVATEGRASKEVIARLKQLYDDAETRAAVVRQEVTLLMREAMLESDFERLRSRPCHCPTPGGRGWRRGAGGVSLCSTHRRVAGL
jgi:hypothetical protein